MTGLKAFIPQLSKALNISEIALYERQRALVRAGLLEHTGGRGPGSGVRLSAEAVAMILIAVLATDSLSETAAAARLLAMAKRQRGPAYKKLSRSLGGAETFKEALVNALSSDEVAAEVTVVRVYRYACVGCFLSSHTASATDFYAQRKEPEQASAMEVMADIQIREIRNLLKLADESRAAPSVKSTGKRNS